MISKKLGLLLDFGRDDYYSGNNHRTASLHIVNLEDRGITNARREWNNKPSEYYDDLQVTCRQSDDKGITAHMSYGWQVDYDQSYHIALETAKLMVATLTHVHKRLDKLTQDFGYPKTFGEFVLRFGRAIGAIMIVTQITHKGGFYSDNEFEYESLVVGCERIDRELETWIANQVTSKTA